MPFTAASARDCHVWVVGQKPGGGRNPTVAHSAIAINELNKIDILAQCGPPGVARPCGGERLCGVQFNDGGASVVCG